MSKTSKLNLFNNIGTEAAPAQAAEPEPSPAAPEAAEPVTQETMTRGKKYAPMSVYLSAEQKATIETIAKATGQSKHAVLQYAVRKVCSEWNAGQWPEMEVKPRLK